MRTSEYSYRGVFDREKEASWGIRKQLHLCVLVVNRTQVTEIRVFPKGSLTLLQDFGAWMMSHTCQVSCSFSLCLFQHKPPASWRLATLSWHSLSTLLISNTALPYNHTAIAPCQPHHSSASCTPCFPSQYPMLSLLLLLTSDCTASHRICLLHCAKPFYITTDSSNTFSNFSQRKPKISLINMSSIRLLLYAWGAGYMVHFSLSTNTQDHIFYCLMLYSVNCT